MARPAGQIIQRGARLWLVRIFLGRDPSTGRRKYHNKNVRGSKKDAQQYLTAALRDRDLGSFARPSSEPLGAYLDRWLETAAKPKLKARTYRDYETLLKAVRAAVPRRATFGEGHASRRTRALREDSRERAVCSHGQIRARCPAFCAPAGGQMAFARLQSGGRSRSTQTNEDRDEGAVARADAGLSEGCKRGPHRRTVRVGGNGGLAPE